MVLTRAGFLKMSSELEDLKTEGRRRAAMAIAEARAQGDLSENAEYDEAMNEQGRMEARIATLEAMLRDVTVIDDAPEVSDIKVGSTVTVIDVELGDEYEFKIVGSAETDPANGLISDESPLGSALIGRCPGETIKVNAPDGVIEYRIVA